MEPEIFKPVNGYEGFYEVSNLGRVKSLARRWSVGVKKDSILKHGRQRVKNKYLTVTFCVNKVRKIRTVHRLVADHFCHKPDECNVVNHLDSDIFNNFYKNLEWTTHRGNTLHAYKNGTMKGRKGTKHHTAKLNEQSIFEIKEMCKKSDISQKEIAKIYGVGQAQISRINTNKRWAHIN